MKNLNKKFFVEFKADQVDDDVIKGYASTFNTINSYGDYVVEGAYTDCLAKLAENGKKLPCLWQHNSDQPIGYFTVLKQDNVGLYCELSLLSNDIQQAREAKALIKADVVTGFSIGAYVEDYEIKQDDDNNDIYALTKLDLREISVVTFPADDNARIEQSEKVLDVRELEHSLRDVGCTRSLAKKYANEICRASNKKTSQCDADNLRSEQILNLINRIEEI